MKWWQGFWGSAEVTLVSLTAEHARDAADVHAATFARPWTDGEIADLLSRPNVFGYAARPAQGGVTLTGFVLVRLAADEAEILTIAVRPDWQGYGVGRRLMDQVLAHAHRERLASLFLEVDEVNAAALALYRKLGFAAVGERPGYYRDRQGERRRAIVMRRDLASPRKRS
ncbi:MAG: ribosomal protein S18-alanine N-acetyltransferase [Roseitalea porphyridii]|jgi:ribosomal-protein-alanine N-acetyltransferase|uniref:ribosomal protein S18-alanine N-acetyltransferase n=1 Tax=Roseitalea porphyridii TaxID=1852022 RepID=UPI0032EFBD84